MAHPVHSPLFMAMDDPVLHRFISYLGEKKAEQEANPDLHISIEMTREFIGGVRESFRQSILDGERHLHILSHLLASILLEGEYELHSNVIGMLPGGADRPFLIRERIDRQTLFSVLDIDLGNQMLQNFRYRKGRSWVSLALAANFVEYLPAGRPVSGVNRLTSRVKAEEELWNKVADEIFRVDEIVSRDKHLRQYSKYIKDIFGIKIVCDDDLTCIDVHEKLEDISRAGAGWEHLGVPLDFADFDNGWISTDGALEFIETKDYLTCDPSELKKTGWKALKSVVEWHGRLFEIQVQPLTNYYLELDHMAGPSHRSFKVSRDSMRDEVTRQLPLYGFYRKLLKMLFQDSPASFEYGNASVVIH